MKCAAGSVHVDSLLPSMVDTPGHNHNEHELPYVRMSARACDLSRGRTDQLLAVSTRLYRVR